MSKNDGKTFLDPFDLNGDGRTDCAEMLVMLHAFYGAGKTEQSETGNQLKITDIDDIDIDGI